MNSLFIALLLTVLPQKLMPAAEVSFVTIETERRDGYTCSIIEYEADGKERVRSFLLVPDGVSADSPAPGVVMLHDHGARFDIGKEKLVRPMASAPEHIKASAMQWVRDGFDGVFFGDRLAGLGFVVIVPDVLYWGGRSTRLCQSWSRMEFAGEPGDRKSVKKAVYEGQRAVYDSLARDGVVWAEKTLREDAAAARLLNSLPFVRNTGCFGWSMGAHRAWLLAAFCPEILSGAALCWMTVKEALPAEHSASDYSMLIPELRERYDFPDIARLIYPKPFLFLSGRSDKLFPEQAVRKAFDRIQEICAESAGESPIRTLFFDGGHHCGLAEQDTVIRFLSETLGAPMR